MSIFREIPPTAGFPIIAKDFLGAKKPGSLEDDFQKFLGAPFAAITYSGAAACYFILESLKKLSSKKTVIVPSFVCPLVALAVSRAGFNVEICDIQKDKFDYNWEELENLCSSRKDILAIIAVHLAGIPIDLDKICAITKKYGIFLIEDCAQALGAQYQGKKVGTFGDFAFFSLCRGKGLTIYEGGVIVTSQPKYIPHIESTISRRENKAIFGEWLKIMELFGYWIFYRPQLFWFVFKLPQIFWHGRKDDARAMGEYADINFPTHKVSTLRKYLGHASFFRIEKMIKLQREKAIAYFDGLKKAVGVFLLKESPSAKAVYPYVTLIFNSEKKRDEILQAVNKKGWGASIVYVSALDGYDFLRSIVPQRKYPNADYLAGHALTLSTSVFLNNEEISNITNSIISLLR